MKFIKDITTENTGGGCMVDFITLNNGSIVAINDEYIGIYKSRADFYSGECVELVEIPEKVYIATWGEGYSHQTTEEHTLDWFNEDKGYDEEQEFILDDLEIGETADFSCISGVHTVKRIK